MNCHQTIWQKYLGWLRTVTLKIPSEEIIKNVVQEEYYHNFCVSKKSAIYRMSKSRKFREKVMPLAA
jgi:hypothetical protein